MYVFTYNSPCPAITPDSNSWVNPLYCNLNLKNIENLSQTKKDWRGRRRNFWLKYRRRPLWVKIRNYMEICTCGADMVSPKITRLRWFNQNCQYGYTCWYFGGRLPDSMNISPEIQGEIWYLLTLWSLIPAQSLRHQTVDSSRKTSRGRPCRKEWNAVHHLFPQHQRWNA